MQDSDDEDEKNPQPKADHAAEKTKEAPDEKAVQDSPLPSDRSVFMYYFTSIGFVNISLIMAMVILFTVVTNFRSEFLCCPLSVILNSA